VTEAIVVGEALMDCLARAGEPVVERPGGSPLNMAVGLGRLGWAATLLTWLGRDARGEAIKAHLAESGVALAPGADGAARTPTATIAVDAAGHPTYAFDLLWEVVSAPDDARPLVVHAGSMGAVFEPGADAVWQLLAASRATATVTFDPNVRPHFLRSPEAARGRIERLVETADLVKASDEDLAWLYPGCDPADAARAWLARGPELVVLTRGGAGPVGLTRAATVAVAGVEVEVADSVGAGDSFMSGLLDALRRRDLLGAGRRGRLAALGEAELAEILSYAAALAAITVSRVGADPPWRRELPGAF
jgi:fructokinase